jgi:hypothetical protein
MKTVYMGDLNNELSGKRLPPDYPDLALLQARPAQSQCFPALII